MDNFRDLTKVPLLRGCTEVTYKRILYLVYTISLIAFIGVFVSYYYIDENKIHETLISGRKLSGYDCKSVGSLTANSEILPLMRSLSDSGKLLIQNPALTSTSYFCSHYGINGAIHQLMYSSVSHEDSDACIADILTTPVCTLTSSFVGYIDWSCEMSGRGDIKVVNTQLSGCSVTDPKDVGALMKEYFPSSELCERFDKLAPFSCSRLVMQSLNNIFSSAAAIANFACGALLTILVQYFGYLNEKENRTVSAVGDHDIDAKDPKKAEDNETNRNNENKFKKIEMTENDP